MDIEDRYKMLLEFAEERDHDTGKLMLYNVISNFRICLETMYANDMTEKDIMKHPITYKFFDLLANIFGLSVELDTIINKLNVAFDKYY